LFVENPTIGSLDFTRNSLSTQNKIILSYEHQEKMAQ